MTRDETDAIGRIARRVVAAYAGHGIVVMPLDIMFALTYVHTHGCRLRLAALEGAREYELLHEVLAIESHLDRSTGDLVGGFVPRFAEP